MIDDFSAEIEAMKTGDYTVTRRGPSTFTAGRKNTVAPSSLTVPGMVHPVEGAAVERLGAGLRGKEVQYIFTAVELRSTEGGEPDVLTIDGAPWQVAKCERWKDLGNFYRSLIVRANK